MTLTWDTSYAIAVELKRRHPEVDIENVGLQQIYAWTIELEEFEDDPALSNDEILASIYQEWFEELINDRQSDHFPGLRYPGGPGTRSQHNDP